VVPIGFHWNGKELVLATAVDSPKTKALTDGAKVAVSIDSDANASEVLLIRGTVRTDTVQGVAPEYAAAVRRRVSEEHAQAHLQAAASVYPSMTPIFIRPD